MIHVGDCVQVMAGMEPDSFDAIVTDPPYGLEFMGKEWDRLKPDVRADRGGVHAPGRAARDAKKMAPVAYGGAPRRSTFTCDACGKRDKFKNDHGCRAGWTTLRLLDDHAAYGRTMQEWHTRWATEALRVAKPGAYLLAFGGTRTVHRLACAIEDAGWIIRDVLCWVYASGFPKSKSSLKPAWEPIVMARKPGPLRMLGIDGCRIGYTSEVDQASAIPQGRATAKTGALAGGVQNERDRTEFKADNTKGRWPANVVLTDACFDGGWDGVVGGGETSSGSRTGTYNGSGSWSGDYGPVSRAIDGDTGTYSRFFLIPKASRADREPLVPGELEERDRADHSTWYQVCGECGERFVDPTTGMPRCGHDVRKWDTGKKRRNTHPTVKPTALMRHLIRLVTPAGGTVLDPFLGSGSTAKAAVLEGFDWVGIEREAEYVAILEQRLVDLQQGIGL